LLGKKSRSLKDLSDYWDVATYFELHTIRDDWTKACQAALHMYLLNPPIWYLKSTINNLKIFHQAIRMRDQQKPREQSPVQTAEEDIYSFWIDFFSDAINSNSISSEQSELPAQVPVCSFFFFILNFSSSIKDSCL
jgi:mitogen-activated protein kinase kinase kinase 5